MDRTPHEPDSDRFTDVFRHYLPDIVFGANDGMITTFAVVSGVTGGSLAPSIVLILGFANLLADGFSMGASNYLSIRSGGRERGPREPLYHALATFLSFVIAGFIPLAAYVIPGLSEFSFTASCLATGAALFLVGALRSLVVSVRWLVGGLEMLGIGAIAAAVAYAAGVLIARLVAA